MKPLYQISNSADIAEHRSRLLAQLRQNEKKIKKDAESVSKSFDRLFSIGSVVGNIISFAAPKLNLLTAVFGFVGKLLKRKKR